jgi:hypothetical protein
MPPEIVTAKSRMTPINPRSIRGSGKLPSGNRYRGASGPAVEPRIVSSNVTHRPIHHPNRTVAHREMSDQIAAYPKVMATPVPSIAPSKPPATWLIEQQKPPRRHPHGSPKR